MPAKITPQRLQRAIQHGFDRLQHFRRHRVSFMREYVGAFYDREVGKALPLNMIHNAVSIIVPNLVANFPKNRVSSRYMIYRDYAEMLALGVDSLNKEIDLRATLRLAITDAIFGMGIIKTGLAVNGQTLELEDGRVNIGQPYADRVDLDDLTFDPMCRDLREAVFIGNKVRVPKAFLSESGLFDADTVEKIPTIGQDGKGGERRSSDLSMGKVNAYEANELVEYVELVEAWLPDDKVIVTMPAGDQTPDRFLRVVDYEGPDTGPYNFLGFAWVPNNPLPVAPCGIWYDLHVLANDIAAKMARQARRQKDVLLYGRSAVDDAMEIMESDDGDVIAVDDPQAVQSVSYGGTNEKGYDHLGFLKAEFSQMAGNIEQLGGVRSDAPTATQAEILQANGTVRLEDMRDLVYIFTAKVNRNLAWYLHTDPLIEMPLTKRLPGGEEIPLTLTPEVRRGEFFDFHFEIEPESMQRMDPNLRVKRMLEWATNVIPAAANAVAQFGPAFNVGKFISITGKALGLRELDELWNEPVFQMQMMEQLARAPQMADSKAMPASDGARPGQTNPMAWYRSQIVDERNQERQQVAAGAQSTYDRVRQAM